MTAQESLQLLDHLCGMMQMNRTDHSRAQEAVRVLFGLISSIENTKSDKKEKDPLPMDFLEEHDKDKKAD